MDDLRLETDVFPLLNYTYAAEAEQALWQLLRELPPSVALVEAKQAVIRGFLANWPVLADFAYPRTQLHEVRTFLRAVSSGELPLDTNPVRLAARLLLSEAERYRSRTRLVQTVELLHRYQQYLLPLVLTEFPAGFRRQLRELTDFLAPLDLAANAEAIRRDEFSPARMARLARQLRAVGPEALAAFWVAFYQFEAYWSLAKGMRALGFTFPTFAEGELVLADFYHPALARPVRNTLRLAPAEHVVVLTGPNMAGKSTLFKAVGICAYLAHAGVGVPAAHCQLPFCHSLLVAIDLRDSLRDGYSHFMAELRHLKQVLDAARQPGHTLAIFDELFRGTNPQDALEITQATIQGLAGRPDSWFLVSTHLSELESRLPGLPGVGTYRIECVLREGQPVFTYRLLRGWSALKIGQLLFEREGLHEQLRAT